MGSLKGLGPSGGPGFEGTGSGAGGASAPAGMASFSLAAWAALISSALRKKKRAKTTANPAEQALISQGRCRPQTATAPEMGARAKLPACTQANKTVSLNFRSLKSGSETAVTNDRRTGWVPPKKPATARPASITYTPVFTPHASTQSRLPPDGCSSHWRTPGSVGTAALVSLVIRVPFTNPSMTCTVMGSHSAKSLAKAWMR
mmetsp:Transcript_19511/g.47107  ORF Transcript_19511/g.47107 Transcript_19511/m.47107 type:complete len:203 (-) Transcript_19511:312-920(-)